MTGTLKERVREEIRAELARQNPVETAFGPLELIAETSIRFTDDGGGAGYEVIDAEGRPRTKVKDGARVGFTIQDVVAELREAHPTLFRSTSNGIHKTAEVAASNAHGPGEVDGSAPATARGTEPGVDGSAEKTRDWLLLGPSHQSNHQPTASAEPSPERNGSPNAPPNDGLSPADLAARLRLTPGAFAAKSHGAREDRPEKRPPPTVQVESRSSPARNRILYGALAGVLGLSILGYLMLGSSAQTPRTNLAPPGGGATASRSPSDPTVTGTIPPNPQGAPASSASSGSAGPISGVPEVIDTSTLRIDGKVVRLFGVEWARGGQAEDLTRYLRNREVACRPAPTADAYRCQVDGRDLSEVVLYNGGGRAASNATPELMAAENHARTERIGIWRK